MTAHDDTAAMVRAALELKDALYQKIGELVDIPEAEERYIRQLKSRYETANYAVEVNADTWLRELLDDRDKLQVVADAARVLMDEVGGVTYSHINWDRNQTYRAFQTLQAHVAALDTDTDASAPGADAEGEV